MSPQLGDKMLKLMKLKNYRCFADHQIPYKDITIMVGRNNAGKSTIIEALRLVSAITERAPNLAIVSVPDWLDLPKIYRGAKIDISNINISWENLFYEYSDPPAIITAEFTDGHKIVIYLGPQKKIHVVITDDKDRILDTRTKLASLAKNKISVLPQISPLEKEEDVLSSEYVKTNVSSYLSSRHFRNQLKIFGDELFNEFKELVESTWPGLQINELSWDRAVPKSPISLNVRDGAFVAEVAWMGHGLQMWLQAIWFLARTKDSNTVVLDEPDVYMHPDLQRKIIRHISRTASQYIIATHSVEIMQEVEPESILVVNRKRKRSDFATSMPGVQNIVNNIGSSINIQLARLWDSKKLILVEGHDLRFLNSVFRLLNPETDRTLFSVPNLEIGGWGGWEYAIGAAMLTKNGIGEGVTIYCILDKDYYPEEMYNERYEKAREVGIELHIWKRKEIENYFIVPSALLRIIMRKNRDVKIDEINNIINTIAESMRQDIIDNIADKYFHLNKGAGLGNANKRARSYIDKYWLRTENKIHLVPGKKMISRLSEWAQKTYGINISIKSLIGEVKVEELDNEIIDVVNAIAG